MTDIIFYDCTDKETMSENKLSLGKAMSNGVLQFKFQANKNWKSTSTDKMDHSVSKFGRE